jgi:hypothetical protein
MQHANSVPNLAAGMKSLPSGQSSLADTQALWRFLNNPNVSPVDLSVPLLEMAATVSHKAAMPMGWPCMTGPD